jgi:hypothetical protein
MKVVVLKLGCRKTRFQSQPSHLKASTRNLAHQARTLGAMKARVSGKPELDKPTQLDLFKMKMSKISLKSASAFAAMSVPWKTGC